MSINQTVPESFDDRLPELPAEQTEKSVWKNNGTKS